MTLKTFRFLAARDALMRGVFFFCALFSLVALGLICVFLFASGVPFIGRVGFGNFFGLTWNLNSGAYGVLSMIVASLYVTALSTLLGVTVGLLTAVSLYKFCPKRVVGPFRQMINLLAGIPSVIYGLFGLFLIVPFLRDHVSQSGVGYGILAASLVLAVMIMPTIVSVSLDALNAIPRNYYEGALALGATREQSVCTVMIPAAKSGILAAVVLSIGRAIGETMAVIMVIGGSPVMPNSLFQSVRTLTANIAMGATELSGEAATALVATGVVLFFFALLLNISFSLLKGDKENKKGKKSKDGVARADVSLIVAAPYPAVMAAAQPAYVEPRSGVESDAAREAKETAHKRQVLKYVGLRLVAQGALIFSLVVLAAVMLFVLLRGLPYVNLQLLFGDYGKLPSIRPALIGTLYLVILALAVAAPVGIGSALFLTEYMHVKGRLIRILRIATETLAGIPSIVYGIFGYLIFVVSLGMGYSLIGGGITLAVMILPVIVRSTEESLLAVPRTLREGSFALGSSKVRTIFSVVLPCAANGIVTSLILAVGRVVSESAVLILTIGMVVNAVPEGFVSPGTSLALDVYYFGSHGYPEQAAATGVVLLVLVVSINLLATGLGKVFGKGELANG